MVNGVLSLAGALGAAIIAAAIGFLTLLISKEQKTSEFRQQWIDSFRAELAKFLSSSAHFITMYHFHDDMKSNNDDYKKRLDRFIQDSSQMMASIDENRALLVLRANPKEHADFLSELDGLYRLISAESVPSISMFNEAEDRLLAASKILLKKEWVRVKRGEPMFFLSKWLALICSVLLPGFLLLTALGFPK